jgi:hypothetical protein
MRRAVKTGQGLVWGRPAVSTSWQDQLRFVGPAADIHLLAARTRVAAHHEELPCRQIVTSCDLPFLDGWTAPAFGKIYELSRQISFHSHNQPVF